MTLLDCESRSRGKELNFFSLNRYIILISITKLLFFVPIVSSQAPGFLNIDCGYLGNNYTTADPTLLWISDGNFVNSGSVGVLYGISSNDSLSVPLQTVRFFSNGTTNCYNIPVSKAGRYLVRMTFFYSDFDTLSTPPVFNVSIGLALAGKIDLNAADSQTMDYIASVQNTSSSVSPILKVCFIRISGDPLVNSIEVRELPTNSYQSENPSIGVQRMFQRMFCGYNNIVESRRYPEDPYDRVWASDLNVNNYGVVYDIQPFLDLSFFKTQHAIDTSADPGNPNYAPEFTFRQSRQVSSPSDTLTFTFVTLDVPRSFWVYLYFAELDGNVTSSHQRSFDVVFNNETVTSNFDVFKRAGDRDFKAVTLSGPLVVSSSPFSIAFAPYSSPSHFSPMISGIEIYQTFPAPLPVDPAIINALQVFRTTLENPDRLFDWTGDPCHPVEWSGVVCKFSSLANTVVELDLAGFGLVGPISPALGTVYSLQQLYLDDNLLFGLIPYTFGNLTALKILFLQNNAFTGSIPSSIATLPVLHILNVANNSLSGAVPISPKATQIITLNANPGLCYAGQPVFNLTRCASPPPSPLPVPAPQPPPPPPPGSPHVNLGALVGLILVVALFVGAVLGLAILCCLRIHKTTARTALPVFAVDSNESSAVSRARGSGTSLPELVARHKAKKMSFQEVMRATNGFSMANQIGVGGFGAVFKGVLRSGTVVAVKKRTLSSLQGQREFCNEMDLLCRVHHRNIVPLLGFCNELDQHILVYKYMPLGSLKDHLHDAHGKTVAKLTWHHRVSIALDAAKGIEYLHNGSSPSIIHRDVNASNILLDEWYGAYIHDLGLARQGPETGHSHVSTTVKGTAGYIDPEYFTTQRLTTKSDVYSFGVVLLELLTGQKPIDMTRARSDWLLVDWARPFLAKNDLTSILDPCLRSRPFRMNAAWKLAETAILCVEPVADNRPTMSDVVRELKEASNIEGIPEGGFDRLKRNALLRIEA